MVTCSESWWLTFFFLLLSWMMLGVRCLHNVEIVVPPAVLVGETVILECKWDLENEEALYSVKWYRSREEFYRYIPKELPHTRVFPLPGIDVDISRSGARRVILNDATPAMAGRFRCEVSADAPTFHTEIRSAHLMVVEPPESSPKMIARRYWFGSGASIEAFCAVPPANPPANITWMLNGEEIEGSALRHSLPDGFEWDPQTIDTTVKTTSVTDLDVQPLNEDNLQFLELNHEDPIVKIISTKKPFVREGSDNRLPTISELRHTVQSNPLKHMKLTCMATIHNLYAGRTEFTFEEEQPEVASVLGVKSGCGGTEEVWMCPVMTSVFYIIANLR